LRRHAQCKRAVCCAVVTNSGLTEVPYTSVGRRGACVTATTRRRRRYLPTAEECEAWKSEGRGWAGATHPWQAEQKRPKLPVSSPVPTSSAAAAAAAAAAPSVAPISTKQPGVTAAVVDPALAVPLPPLPRDTSKLSSEGRAADLTAPTQGRDLLGYHLRVIIIRSGTMDRLRSTYVLRYRYRYVCDAGT
jgi:hypothetical protein